MSSILLAIVFHRAESTEFGALARNTDWSQWILGLVVVILSPVATGQRARVFFRALDYRVSLGSLTAVNLEAIFFGLIVPGELLAGVVRWDRFSRHTGSRTSALALLASERLIDTVALALITAAGAPLFFGDGELALQARIWTVLLAVAIALLGASLWTAGGSSRFQRAMLDWRGPGSSKSRRWLAHLAAIAKASRALIGDSRRTAEVLSWTGVFWCLFMIGSLTMARAVFPQTPPAPYVAATAALVLLSQIPITIAGVGLREFSLPVLLGTYGVTDEVGLLIGISAFVPYALLGLGGLVLHLTGYAELRDDRSPPSSLPRLPEEDRED